MKRSVCTNYEFVTVITDSYTQQLTKKQDNAMTDLFQDKISGYSVELLAPVTFSAWVSTFRMNLLCQSRWLTQVHIPGKPSLCISEQGKPPLCIGAHWEISKDQRRMCSTYNTICKYQKENHAKNGGC